MVSPVMYRPFACALAPEEHELSYVARWCLLCRFTQGPALRTRAAASTRHWYYPLVQNMRTYDENLAQHVHGFLNAVYMLHEESQRGSL